jgi:ribonuclease HII
MDRGLSGNYHKNVKISSMKETEWVIGVDEAGRGPLAGPVYVGAVAVPKGFLKVLRKLKIRDSKKLTRDTREMWLEWLEEAGKQGNLLMSHSRSSHGRIDKVGITRAVSEALNRSIAKLELRPVRVQVLLDGLLHAPTEFKRQETITKGDEKHEVIALASIIAKVKRDRYMHGQSKKFAEYGFERHVGYGTHEHREKIRKYGLCEIHRKSYCRKLTELRLKNNHVK